MGERRRVRVGERALAGLVVALLVVCSHVIGIAPAAAYPSDHVSLVGHGFGHGRGMGQYGALGYALSGSSWQSIVGRYYSVPSVTTLSSAPNSPIGVRLTDFDNRDTIVVQEKGLASYNGTAAPLHALLVRLVQPNPNPNLSTFQVYAGADCAGGTTRWGTPIATISGPVTISSPNSGDDHTTMLQGCELNGGTRWYRGSMVAMDSGVGARTVNQLPVESYLRGVVPRESPAFWGTLGGGLGEQALEAQAVAARSYALSTNDYSYAQICDTTACEVYGGRAEQVGGVYQDLEGCGPTRTPCIPGSSDYDTSDSAVASTAGQVMRMVSSGAVARTEFSSSTGGYTAGGTFPAVPDDGDATPSNPYHTWTATISVPAIQAAYPQIGSLQSIAVTQRNGLGDLGGRVSTLVVKGGTGSVTVSGSAFASTFGLRSDWFAIVNGPSGGLNGYWLVASDGGIFAFGGARFFGSTGGMHLNQPVVGMTSRPTAAGYWLVASDGGLFAFGDAPFQGSLPSIRAQMAAAGMKATATGDGYLIAAANGAVFSFGDAPNFGGIPDVVPGYTGHVLAVEGSPG